MNYIIAFGIICVPLIFLIVIMLGYEAYLDKTYKGPYFDDIIRAIVDDEIDKKLRK